MEDHKRSGVFLMFMAMILFMAQTYTNASPLPLGAQKPVEEPNVSDAVRIITKRSSSFGPSSQERLRYAEEPYFPAELAEKARYNADAERLAEPIPKEYSRVTPEEAVHRGRNEFEQIMMDAQKSLLSTSDALGRIVEYLKPDIRYDDTRRGAGLYEPRWPERNVDDRYESELPVDRYNEPRWESDRYATYEPEWSYRRVDPSDRPAEWSEGRRLDPIETEWLDRRPIDDRYGGENDWLDRKLNPNEPEWLDRRFGQYEPQWPNTLVNDRYEAEWRPAKGPELLEYENGKRRKGGLIDYSHEYINGHVEFKLPKAPVTAYRNIFDEDCDCDEDPDIKDEIDEPENPLEDIFKEHGLEQPANLTGTAKPTEVEKSTGIPASPKPKQQTSVPSQSIPADGPTEIKPTGTTESKPISPLHAAIIPNEANEETPVKSPQAGAQPTPAASSPNTNAGPTATGNNPIGTPTETTNDGDSDDPAEQKTNDDDSDDHAEKK